MSDLASFCGLNPTMLSRMVPKLEEAGFLRREADPTDGRVWRVEATKKARTLLARVRTERNDALSKLLDELDDCRTPGHCRRHAGAGEAGGPLAE